MAQITSIKQQKKKNRVNVYLDDKFGFGIDLDNFVLLNLRVGQELSETEVEEIIKKAEFQKTLDKLLNWAMGRPHSEKEIRDYLKRKKTPEVIYDDLFEKLKYFDLVDDEKFTRFFVESRNAFRPKPKRILKQELRMKGIKQEIIDKVLSENEIDESKIALEALVKRKIYWERVMKGPPSRSYGEVKQKMLIYLVGKGFAFEIAKKAVRSYNTS